MNFSIFFTFIKIRFFTFKRIPHGTLSEKHAKFVTLRLFSKIKKKKMFKTIKKIKETDMDSEKSSINLFHIKKGQLYFLANL